MTSLTTDPLATVVHRHIAELRQEATRGRVVRTAREGREARRADWPGPVARALRELFARPSSASPAACPTC